MQIHELQPVPDVNIAGAEFSTSNFKEYQKAEVHHHQYRHFQVVVLTEQ